MIQQKHKFNSKFIPPPKIQFGGFFMKFEFVKQKEVAQARKEIEQVILKVQDYLRENNILTFQYNLVGSAGKRHLVTRVIDGNKGFDLDFNLSIQQLNNDYNNAKKIKTLFMQLFDKFKPNYFSYSENSTSVFTIKKIDQKTKKILYSFDFAIVNYFEQEMEDPDYDDERDDPSEQFYVEERQEYIRCDKLNGKESYFWELRKVATDHQYMEVDIKKNGLWNELRDLYLKKKNNNNNNPNKKSRIIYYESLNEVWQKHFA